MISVEGANIFIILSCVLGLVYGAINTYLVSKIKLIPRRERDQEHLAPLNEEEIQKQVNEMIHIGKAISEGAEEFLHDEYKILSGFLAAMSLIIFLGVDLNNGVQFYTTVAFILGAITSIISGYIGMHIATYSNTRTAYEAQKGLAQAFVVAIRAGFVMGFSLVSLGLLLLTLLIWVYRSMYADFNKDPHQLENMYDCIAGYGLGGSMVALFGRVGGGIYTKAADVGADLVGKVEKDLPEDSPRNPATIADNVGDNVGDIAGMGADLFGSFAESTCAALAIASSSSSFYQDGQNGASLYFPLMITAFGIIASFLTSFFATNFMKVEQNEQIEHTLKVQLVISTILLTPALYGAAALSLPEDIIIPGTTTIRHPVHAWICAVSGLWAGLVIGYFTEYMTSHSYTPVREVANSCSTGPATNVIYGLALGYLSTIVPIISLAICAYLSHKLFGMLGIALAALGMLSNLATGLAIDAYGPISDNAGGIAEMAELGPEIRKRTDALDAAGNTTAAIGKGFAIGSAHLVAVSLYGAFITRAKNTQGYNHPLQTAEVTDGLIFTGLLLGAMLPYAFSAMTMKSVGKAALQMVEEVRRQLKNHKILTGEEDPDYKACVRISTIASLKDMIAPGALVIFTPLVVGFFLGPKAIAGLLPGIMVSGVQLAISMSNTGGAWDNAKKYIEGGYYKDSKGEVKKKGSDEHKAAVIGDTVGDPLKDTSGPSLNILVKLSAILSLVFTTFYMKTGYLVCLFGETGPRDIC